MKHEMKNGQHARRSTLGDLVSTVNSVCRNDHEAALAVADLINRRRVKILGPFKNFRVVLH
ncbi:hypothetical protein A2890_02860 [candidate division WWE3 bacterium RIFCSPLOWO2_01_FULL_53_14]|uniref:Uncharacterized protein n=1 Tax=candidate division WWE3 bacterium RIFCSPLOWO2_01_FULL_53_14 TaxID=1802628 RepID=A0A1F4VVN8_UNCKA|nr:MAG: hypothetical protein A2890_02860 [candidate division WWE3 bacterium RIFCSPLOWO2_01_FULL_53_14]